MLLKTFLEEYNNAPVSLREVAGLAIDVQDDKALAKAAEKLEDAYYDFEIILEEIGFELG